METNPNADPAVNLLKLKEKLRTDEETLTSLLLQLIVIRHDISVTRSEIEQYEIALQKPYISILSSDILALIFSNAADPNNVWWLVHLSHVCRQWRDVTLYTPLLWAKNVRIEYQYPRRLLEIYLERSGACPLDIAYDGGDLDDGDENPEHDPEEHGDPSPHCLTTYEAIDTLLSCIGRCRRLELCSLDSSRCLERLAADNIFAPYLETLVMEHSGHWVTKSPTQILKGGTPRLSSLVLNSVPASLGIGCGSNALTCLLVNGNQTDLHGTLDALRALPLLKQLRLDMPSIFVERNFAPVELNYLLSLEARAYLHRKKSDVMHPVLSIIKAPLLHHLVLYIFRTVSMVTEGVELDLPAFPMLQTLTINIDGHDALPSLAREFPDISHLEVMSVRMWRPRDMSHLLQILGSEVKWPFLKQLTTQVTIVDDDIDTLIDFVENRKRAGYLAPKIVLPQGRLPMNNWFKSKTFSDVGGLLKFSDVVDIMTTDVPACLLDRRRVPAS